MASVGEGSEKGNIRNVIRIDEGEIRNHLDGLVKTSVEEVLNQYLDHDPDKQCPGEDEPGDQEANPGSWQLPGRAVRFDAGIRQAEACRGDPVGIEALPGHEQTSKPKPKKEGS